MKIPILEKLTPPSYKKSALMDLFEQKAVGNKPFFIELNFDKKEKALNAIDNIVKALEELNINTFLPYPIYLICSHKITHPQITILENKEDLPAHFIQKVKKLNNRERLLHKKIEVLTQKIHNFEISKKVNILKESSEKNKVFFIENLKNQKLQSIFSRLKDNYAKRNR